MTITGPSGTFGNEAVVCTGATAPCAFTNVFTFVTPDGFTLTSATISSVETVNPATDLDFTSVTLNGREFTTIAQDGTELRQLLNLAITPSATNTLRVAGDQRRQRLVRWHLVLRGRHPRAGHLGDDAARLQRGGLLHAPPERERAGRLRGLIPRG